MGREQIVLAHQAEHPLAGNPDVATDPKPSPDLAVALALPGRCLQVGFDRHHQRLVRDRGLRSPTLCRRAARRAGRRSWRRTRRGPCPRRRRPAAGRRPDPCRARWRHSSPRPPPPQRAEGLRLGLQQFHLHGQLSDPLHGAIQFRLHRIALALLERGVDPADRFLTPLLEPEDLYAHAGATEVAPARHAKAAERPHACAPPSIAGQVAQRACIGKAMAWGPTAEVGSSPTSRPMTAKRLKHSSCARLIWLGRTRNLPWPSSHSQSGALCNGTARSDQYHYDKTVYRQRNIIERMCRPPPNSSPTRAMTQSPARLASKTV